MGAEADKMESHGETAIIQAFHEIQGIMSRISSGKGIQTKNERPTTDLILKRLEFFFDKISPPSLACLPTGLSFQLIAFYVFAFLPKSQEELNQTIFAKKYNFVNFIVSNAELFYLSYDCEMLLYHFQLNLELSDQNLILIVPNDFDHLRETVRERYISVLVSIAPYCIVDDFVYRALHSHDMKARDSHTEGSRDGVCRHNEIIKLWKDPELLFEWLYCLVKHKCIHRTTLKYIFDSALYFDAVDGPFRYMLLSEVIKAYTELDTIAKTVQIRKEIKEGIGLLMDSRKMLESCQYTDGKIVVEGTGPQEGNGLSRESVAVQIKDRIKKLETQLNSIDSTNLEKYKNQGLRTYYIANTDIHQDNAFVLVSNIWDELILDFGDASSNSSLAAEQGRVELLIVMLNLTGDFLRLRIAESQKILLNIKSDKCRLLYAISQNCKAFDSFPEMVCDGLQSCKHLRDCAFIKAYFAEKRALEPKM